jgi:hypothetical protein
MGKTDAEIAAKKAAKKAKKEKEAKGSEAPAEEKKEKKEKKDKKDKKRENDGGDDDKSSKKAKSTSVVVEAAIAKYAAVGDQELAKASGPFKRAFYTPAATVAKMSQKEVDARREVGLYMLKNPVDKAPGFIQPLKCMPDLSGLYLG